MKLKDFFSFWLPALAWCGVIFGLSSIPTLPTPKIIWWDFVLKKSAHVIEYAILYFLVYRAVNKNPKSEEVPKTNWFGPFLFCLLYAVSDEYHQKFVPGRHAKPMDIGFDTLGMVISYLKLEMYC
jgi:VanZ family protein